MGSEQETMYLGPISPNARRMYEKYHLSQEKKTYYFPLYWLFNRDPYNGLLYPRNLQQDPLNGRLNPSL